MEAKWKFSFDISKIISLTFWKELITRNMTSNTCAQDFKEASHTKRENNDEK